MRKILFVSFSFLFFVVSYSQKYQPIDSTTVWNNHNYWRIASGTCCYVNEYSSFQFHGFVTNNGNTWLKLHKTGLYSRVACSTPCNEGTVPSNYTNAFVGYVMNDSLNKKVYFTPTLTANYTPTISNIVYDFANKTVGDSLKWRSIDVSFFQGSGKFQILAIDSFLFATKYHKRYKVVNNSLFTSREIYVMEGMGSSLGAWNSYFSEFEQNSKLTCFTKPTDPISVPGYTTFIPASTACGTLTALPELEQTLISVYPNPATNLITLENIETGILSIYDLSGKLIMKEEVKGSINIRNLLPGIYFLKIISANKIYSSRFVKE